MSYILIAFMVLCSSFFWVGIDLRSAQEIFFQLGGSALILSLFFVNTKPIKRNIINILIGAFGVYGVILYLVGGKPEVAPAMLNIFIGCMIYFFTLHIDPKHTGMVLKTILWICVLNLALMALQALGLDPIFLFRSPTGGVENINSDLIGFMGIKAVMGILMGLGAIVMLAINPIVSLVLLVPIYISKCSGVLVGLFLAVPFYLFYTRKILFKVVTPVLILLGVCYMLFVDAPMGMMNTRPAMWKLVLRDTIYCNGDGSRFLRNPITGFGLDSFRRGNILYFKKVKSNETIRAINNPSGLTLEDGRKFYNKNVNGHRLLFTPDNESVDFWDNPHNEFIQLFREMGLIGVLLVGFIGFFIWKRFDNIIKRPKLVCCMALVLFLFGTSISQFPFHLARIGFILPILVGLIVINSEVDNEKR